jgi:hypothetical protein
MLFFQLIYNIIVGPFRCMAGSVAYLCKFCSACCTSSEARAKIVEAPKLCCAACTCIQSLCFSIGTFISDCLKPCCGTCSKFCSIESLNKGVEFAK